MASLRHRDTVEVNGIDLDIESAEGSKMQAPSSGTTDKDAIKDYIEFMTRSETIPMARLRTSEAKDSEDDDAEESDNE